MEQPITSHNLGFPRIGAHRELKRATESYWKGETELVDLLATGAELRRTHWLLQQAAGLDLIPSNDFSFYDQMLDMSCLLGNIPSRFGWQGGEVDLDLVFRIARGLGRESCGCSSGTAAAEMTKWFDTNYHYIVPELHRGTVFRLSSDKPFAEFSEALALGIRTKPVLIGPLTYLFLGKSAEENFESLSLLDQLVSVYGGILTRLAQLGAEWVQIDEPILALDLPENWRQAFASTYAQLKAAAPGLKLLLATYFGELRENMATAVTLPVDALHIDLTRGEAEFDALLSSFPPGKSLSLGLVDGRNIWRNNFDHSQRLIQQTSRQLGCDRIWVAPSCSLLHSPVSLAHEKTLNPEIRSWLAFAEEKLEEVVALARLGTNTGDPLALHRNQVVNASRRSSSRIHRDEVKARAASIDPSDADRSSPFAIRQISQREAFGLPAFPTTTIGSFPQTKDIRSARARWKKGELTDEAYRNFLEDKTRECIRIQEEIGLDVLVHGEFERNDMVEYFGEQLEGFTFTANGWVQSYGSRCVKPPIIFGDVSRPRPMTVEWSSFAQSQTSSLMKGMLTGPITILQWSFVRDDQPRRETARQIALAIRDEVLDLEAAGLRIIQIDEPALREGLPLRRQDWSEYLAWATEAFRLSASGVQDETQIHTHMCYCEFNDIIDSIAALDADVISIETSRSNMELLEAFSSFQYPNEVGPGVWDIHSPRVPTTEEMANLLRKAAQVLPAGNLWVNPDCGLKTRGWAEVKAALSHMISAAHLLRTEQKTQQAIPCTSATS